MTQEERVILADPRRSPRSAAAIWVAGAVQVLGGVWILASGVEQSAAARLVLSSLALVSGALFLQVGRILGEEKGGLAWLPGHRILEVGGPARGAALRVPGAVIRAVQVRRRTERWGREEAPVEVASVELSLRGGAAVLLAEAGPEDAADFAGLVRRQTGLPAEPEDTAGEAPAAPPPRGCERLPEGLRARVGPWTPLALPMATTGVLALGVGGLLLADVTREPVFGFLFGPTLAALGLCLLAPLGVRAVAREILHTGPESWTHEIRIPGLTLFRRALPPVEGEPGRVRVASRGAQGFCLHLVRGGSLLVALGGVGPRTRLSPEDLLSLAGVLARDAGAPGGEGKA